MIRALMTAIALAAAGCAATPRPADPKQSNRSAGHSGRHQNAAASIRHVWQDPHNRLSRESHRSPAVSGAYRFRPCLRGSRKPRRGDPGISRRLDGGREQKAGAVPAGRRSPGPSAHRRAPWIGWDGSLRPRRTTRRHSSSARKTPRSGMTRAIATISRGGGPTPSERSRRPRDSRPTTSEIRTNLGLTLAAAGRTDEALPLLSQSNGDAIGHANLGYLLAATGQVDLARQQYETALALRPDLEAGAASPGPDRPQRARFATPPAGPQP